MSEGFSWKRFGYDYAERLARSLGGYSKSAGDPQDWLDANHSPPTSADIGKCIKVLKEDWIESLSTDKIEEIVQQLVDCGLGLENRVPAAHRVRVQFIQSTRNSSGLNAILLESLISDCTKVAAPPPLTKWFVEIDPRKQNPVDFKAYPCQHDAWSKMSTHFRHSEDKGIFAGLLVMPTVSGKTITAVRWLLENIINNGGTVLWLAHRTELLDQAAQTFDQFAHLATKRSSIRRRIVSGQHGVMAAIVPDQDDIILCSIQSLARNSAVASELLAVKKLFLVVDEAHHAQATTYREFIQALLGI